MKWTQTTSLMITLAAMALLGCYVEDYDRDHHHSGGYVDVHYSCESGYHYEDGWCVPSCPSGVYQYGGCVPACDLTSCDGASFCVVVDEWDAYWDMYFEVGYCEDYCPGGCYEGYWCDREYRTCWSPCDYDPCYSYETCVPDEYDPDTAHCYDYYGKRAPLEELPGSELQVMSDGLWVRYPTVGGDGRRLAGLGENLLPALDRLSASVEAVDPGLGLAELDLTIDGVSGRWEARFDGTRWSALPLDNEIDLADGRWLEEAELTGRLVHNRLIVEGISGVLYGDSETPQAFEIKGNPAPETDREISSVRTVTISTEQRLQ